MTESNPSVPELIQKLSSPDPTLRSQAASALGALCNTPEMKQAVPALLRLLGTEKNKMVRLWGTDALVRTSFFTQAALGPKMVPALLAAFKEGIPMICSLLKDPDPMVSSAMFSVITYMGPNASGAIPTLRQLLRHENQKIQKDTRNALKWLGTPEALKALEEYQKGGK